MGTCGHICVNARVLLLLSTPSRTNSVGSATELEVAAKRNYSSTNSGNIFFLRARALVRSRHAHSLRVCACASAYADRCVDSVFALFGPFLFLVSILRELHSAQ